MGEEFDLEEVKGLSVVREVFDWVESGLTALVCMVFIFAFLGRIVGVEGVSMLPTLRDGDRLVTSRLFYTPQYGDIVVVTKPNERNEPLIKRVIATEGQTVEIDAREGVVFVDGRELHEVAYQTLEATLVAGDWEYPVKVPEGHVFVMGDNRNHSWDSRMQEVGMVDQRYILGKVYYRILPFEDMGKP